ncbi:hypothetical protein COP1_036484 [Malus domestica]
MNKCMPTCYYAGKYQEAAKCDCLKKEYATPSDGRVHLYKKQRSAGKHSSALFENEDMPISPSYGSNQNLNFFEMTFKQSSSNSKLAYVAAGIDMLNILIDYYKRSITISQPTDRCGGTDI